jgi:hypothetical protein
VLLRAHREQLIQLIQNYELGHCQDFILQNSYSVIGLETGGEEDYTEPGRSRFFGDPDLPPDWPEIELIEERAFLFQVNFSELSVGPELGLPAKGMLLVFGDPYIQEWEDCLTFFLEDISSVKRFPMPPPPDDSVLADITPMFLSPELNIGFEVPEALADGHEPYEDEDKLMELANETGVGGVVEFAGGRGGSPEHWGVLDDCTSKLGGRHVDYRQLWRLPSSDLLQIGDYHEWIALVGRDALATNDFDQIFVGFI